MTEDDIPRKAQRDNPANGREPGWAKKSAITILTEAINRRREAVLPLAWTVIVLFAVVALTCSPANAELSCHNREGTAVNPWRLPSVTFPSAGDSLASPDHRYVVRNVDSGTQMPSHTLWLEEESTGQRVKLYQYPRWVNVLWSPSSDALVVNDFYASDDSRVMLFVIARKPIRTDVSRKLERFLSKRNETKLLQGYPTFAYATRWINRDTIEISFQGFAGTSSTGEYREPLERCFFYKIAAHSFASVLSTGDQAK